VVSEAVSTGPAPRGRDDRSIVVAVDGSPSSKAALAWAGRYAALSGTPLVAVVAWEFPIQASWGMGPPLPEDFDPEGAARQVLEETVAEVLGDHAGIDLRLEVVRGHPSVVLTERSKSASLVVMGSRGHGAFTGMLLGSVSEFLATHAHCPVVVMRDHTATA
jgi:nucleotide-binding universal stress UspA family protein